MSDLFSKTWTITLLDPKPAMTETAQDFVGTYAAARQFAFSLFVQTNTPEAVKRDGTRAVRVHNQGDRAGYWWFSVRGEGGQIITSDRNLNHAAADGFAMLPAAK